jgi:hypothetical protein
MVRRTVLKPTSGRDEKPETDEMPLKEGSDPPAGEEVTIAATLSHDARLAELAKAGSDLLAAASGPTPEPAPNPDSAAPKNPIPPFESIDPKVFQSGSPGDAAAKAAAAAEKNTSAFFAELENYRLDETETQGLGVGREILTSVPVRRPGRKEFFRCHPDSRTTLALALFVDDGEDGDGETYLVSKDMRETFGEDVTPTLLQLSMLRNGTIILMPLKIPTVDSGRGRRWRESLMLAADIAKTQWIKITSDRGISGYRVFPALGQISEPKWPGDKTFEEYLEIAFRDRIIKSMDHPVVRKYRGQ